MKKGISSELLGIILVVVGMVVAILLFLLLSTKGKFLLGNVSNLNLTL